LRIVQAAACAFPSPQGSQVYVRGMARALARRGHDVSVVCYGHGMGAPDADYRVIRTPALLGYDKLRAGPDLVKPVLDLALVWRLLGLHADVVHAHNYEAPLAASLARVWTGTPMVYSAHNTMREELPTYFEGRATQYLLRRVGTLLDRTVPRLADHAIALGPSTVDVLLGLGCREVTCVPPGVEPDDLRPARPARLPPGAWVVYAGNPDRYQDLDVLLAAMHRVPEARLLLVSASSLDALGAAAPPGTRCVRTADFEQVRSLLAAADLAALPRSVCSGYPIKLLNYLGMGLPVVAAAGSARCLPGVVVVPDRDPAAMARALRLLLADRPRRIALGRRARGHVLQHCTWGARAAELEIIYRRVLAKSEEGVHGRLA